jgi:SPOR domain
MRSVRDWVAGAPAALLAATLAVIVIGAGLFGFAIAELTSGDDGGDTPAARAPAVVGGSTQGGKGVPSWPGGLSAYTVVIGRAPDRATAVSSAKEARRAGLDAGVMEAARHGLGGRGRWLVYTGTFAARGGARDLAKRLAVRYPGATVELAHSSQ